KYLRVDLYLVQEKIYVGELTFHQGSGYDKITPFEWDERLGKELKL
ncbi:glycosyl transferase, partial [Escherichia coli]|nr:glycosyl transferase [Escherichia coli]